MTTAAELIASSLRKLGVIASGETPDGNDYADGMDALNDILESWSTEGLTVYSLLTQTFTISAAQTFTIGPGGNLDGVRPIRVISAKLDDVPLRVVSSLDDVDNSVFYDADMPLGRLTINAESGGVLEVVSEQQFTPMTDPDQVLALPPGYRRALKYELAVDLADDYNAPLTPSLVQLALSAKADIKRPNNKSPIADIDPAWL